MTLCDRITRRFRASRGWTWADVEKELRQLQATGQLAQGRIDKQVAAKLAEAETFDMLPHAFSEWYRLAYTKEDLHLLGKVAGDMRHGWRRVLWAYWGRGGGPREIEKLTQTAKKNTKVYLDDVGAAIAEITAARLTYQGFKIENHDRMPHDKLKLAFDKIDWLVAFFKQQGMLKLLQETLTKISLSMRDHETASAHYHAQSKHIEMHRGGLVDRGGRLWKDWVQEVFIHEIGHHIHYYLHPEAWAIWEAPWKEIEKKERTRSVLTGQERERFWKLMEANRWHPSTVAKRLKGLDRVKFTQWLRRPLIGESLITPKTFRPSKWGKSVFEMLRDPVKYKRLRYPDDSIEDVEREAADTVRRRRRSLGLDDFASEEISLSRDILEELKAADPSVEEAIEALEIPSNYGKTNLQEDFAETFILFVTNPSRLSATAKFRMQQALAISGLYGKAVGRFANNEVVGRVVGRFAANL